MSSNPQLLYAILSMDAYHQGAIGGLADLLREYPTQIDDTVRGRNDSNDETGFSAQSYTRGSETIIVYRGTDDGGTTLQYFGSSLDVANGYSIALGAASNPQTRAAVAFYRSFVGDQNLLDANNITLVGQSLGGGLAGYVGALYGQQYYVFDSEPYMSAVANAYDIALNGLLFRNENGPDTRIPNDELRDSIYGTGNPAVAPSRLLNFSPADIRVRM